MLFRFFALLFLAGSMHAAGFHLTIQNYANVPPHILFKARSEAARVLSTASIPIHWGDPSGNGLSSPEIRVNLVTEKMAAKLLKSDASCGKALPTGSVVWIDYGCAGKLAQNPSGERLGQVLGCLIAHEVSHVLLSDHRHDDSGLLRAKWGKEELSRIARGDLTFQSPDQIHRRVQHWRLWPTAPP